MLQITFTGQLPGNSSATELQTCGGWMTLFAAGGRSHLDATWSVSVVFCCKLFWSSSSVTS